MIMGKIIPTLGLVGLASLGYAAPIENVFAYIALVAGISMIALILYDIWRAD